MATAMQRAARAMHRQAKRPSVLAAAPVKPAPYCPPLHFADREAATVRVVSEWVNVASPGESWETHGDLTYVGDYANKLNDQAALRAQLTDAVEWGGDCVRVAVLLDDGLVVRRVILEGTMAAIRRALPDQATVEAWKEAGAVEFPLFDFSGEQGAVRAVTWVAIDRVPRVVQMEYEARGLTDAE